MMINLNKVWNDNPFDYWTEEELLCMEEQGICYGKGSSSPPPPPTVTTQTQVSEFPTELRPFISDIFEKSQAVQEQRQAEGFQPELTQQLAPFTPDQQTAFEGIRQQVGQTRPLFEEATELARSSARGATDPAELAALMNPFLRNVVDIEKREAERVADVQEQQLAARAAQAGAFGGSRAGIIEAERQRNLATQLGDIESRGLALAFQDAQNRLQNQFGREASAAGQLSALGTAIPAQTFKELGALSGIGAAEQQQGQRALDIATQQAREEFGFPQQTLQDFSSILRGFPLPATTNVSRSTFSPAQPLATQLLGLGTGLAGLATSAGAFKKAGGRVGAPAPVALKNGGYIKLAGGGGLGEMMQENLPSNRVRMGKVAYQDAGMDNSILRSPEGLDLLSRNELVSIINDPQKMLELNQTRGITRIDILNRIQAKEAAGRAELGSGIVEGAKALPGQLQQLGASAGDAIQQGFKAVSPLIPRSGGLADETAAAVEMVKGAIPKSDPRLGMDTTLPGMDPTGMRGQTQIPASLLPPPALPLLPAPSQVRPEQAGMDPTGMRGQTRIPASLLSPPKLQSEEIVGGGPSSLSSAELAQRRGEAKLAKAFKPTAPLPSMVEEIVDEGTSVGGQGSQAAMVEEIVGDGVDIKETITAEQKNKKTSEGYTREGNTDLQIPKYEKLTQTFDIDKYEQDFANIEGKDFMTEVRKKIGEVPILEKRKEFDPHPRVGAMLMKAAGAILGSTKGPVEAMAGAFNVIGKDMTELATAREKYEDAARQERNQDKIRKYNQEAKFYAAGETAKAKALQNLTNVSQTRQKFDDGELSRKKAEVSMLKDINAMTIAEFTYANSIMDRDLKEAGQMLLGDFDSRLDKTLSNIAAKTSAAVSASGGLMGASQLNSIRNTSIDYEIQALKRAKSLGKVVHVVDGVKVPYNFDARIAQLEAMRKGKGGSNGADGGQRRNRRFDGGKGELGKAPTAIPGF